MDKLFTITLFFTLAIFSSMHSYGQTFVKSDATGSSDGTSWENAYESVDKALANVSSGEIWIAAGTYHPAPDTSFTISNNISMYGGFNGTESTLAERNPAVNETILSGDLNDDDIQNDFTVNKSDNVLHVINIASTSGTIVIDGFSIIGGHTQDDPDLDIYQRAGAAIYALSPVVIENCAFYNNFGRSGASIYFPAESSGSSVSNSSFKWNSTSAQSAGILVANADGCSIVNCEFSNNRTVRGALYALRSNNVQISDCTFSFNTNTDGPGGAIWNFGSVGMAINNTIFESNKANNGGAIFYSGAELMNLEGAGNFVISGCTFSKNEATASSFGVGGAIRNSDGSYTLNDCIFSENSAVSSGGHIRNDTDGDEVIYNNCLFEDAISGGWGGAHTCYGPGTYTITNCEYEGNTCPNFGGAVNCGIGADQVTFDGCSFNGNFASSASGGALYVQNDSTNLSVLNCSFENNSSSNDGGAIGVFSSQQTVVENSSFIFNTCSDFGGAINLFEDSLDIASLNVLNSTFILNQAGNQGGAISTGDADATFVSCLFGENAALGNSVGGGLSLNASDSNEVNVSILHCTIANNVAELGAGFAQWTGTSEALLNTTMQSSILFNESGDNYVVEAGTPNLISNGGNMSSDNTLETLFTQTTDLNNTSPNLVDPDALDYNLEVGSPGIDAGIEAGAPLTDILGNSRINSPDMGAYENQEVTGTKEQLIENNGHWTISPNPAKGAFAYGQLKNNWTGSLTVTITDANGKAIQSFEMEKSGEESMITLALHQLPTGIYQVAISNGHNMIVDRLIRL